MKKAVQRILQGLLGFDRYLYWFARVKIATLRWDKRDGDFLHFVDMVADDAKVLDIGANIGIMTSLVARKCERGQVHAFEPIPENVLGCFDASVESGPMCGSTRWHSATRRARRRWSCQRSTRCACKGDYKKGLTDPDSLSMRTAGRRRPWTIAREYCVESFWSVLWRTCAEICPVPGRVRRRPPFWMTLLRFPGACSACLFFSRPPT